MGQILGMGFSGGDKSKSQTTVNLPPELRNMYRQQTEMAQGMMPQYRDLLARAMGGDTEVVAPYARPVAGTYQNVADQAYVPMAGTYTPVSGQYAATEGAYRPVSANFASVTSNFHPGTDAYTAPYAAQIQNALAQIRRSTPSGGGQQAAVGQATMQGAMQMGAARAGQRQRDIDAWNALLQEDVRTKMGLGIDDTRRAEALRAEDIRTRMGMGVEDVRAGNTLTQKDLAQLAQLRGYDANQRNVLAAGDVQKQNEMMQRILQLYAGLFGGFNPAQAAGQTQTSSTPGTVGIPFASFNV